MSLIFPLYRGTRQGCPLIFASALEPLAAAIRDNANIKGIQAGKSEHKLLLYADDVLLLTTNPEAAVPHVLSLIDSFSLVSGYRVNWGKSEAMPLSTVSPPRIDVSKTGSLNGFLKAWCIWESSLHQA